MSKDMNELVARIEAADQRQADGGYALDGEIAKREGWTYSYREATHSWGWCRPGMPDHFNARPPAYTTSIDAAMSLVPEGWSMSLGEKRGLPAHIRWNVWLHDHNTENGIAERSIEASAATPSLALCAAALRAKASDHD